MKDRDSDTILIAAGGTGGHLFPALALAQELRKRGRRAVLAVDGRAMKYIKEGEYETILLDSGRKGVFKIAAAVSKSFGIIRKYNARVVVGFGGYPSFPPLLAALFMRRRIVIHEQNAVAGKVNRIFSRFAWKVAVSFSGTKGIAARTGIIVTGNPVREAMAGARDVPYKSGGNVLVVGGSQGASIFSRVVPKALCGLGVSVTQQCRDEDLPGVREYYASSGVKAELAPFFSDMDKRMAEAALVITRSGAGTVAELCAVGRPAILVPFAAAAGDHQTENAKAMVLAGAGWIIKESEFTSEALAGKLRELLASPEILEQAARNARALGNIEAAASLAEELEAEN